MLKLADGEVLDLRLGPVVKHLGEATVARCRHVALGAS